MTIGIHFSARSDVGLLREGNEDSAYAGPRLLAVADGMGGHVGGEIASAAAIDALKPLDTDVPAPELLGALEHAVQAANDTLHRIVETDPTLQGMGTTLTAMLWSGSHVALVHIGDSRAYLLRGGELFQITHDHTLVQSLVDEGRISIDEAASHPQRSLLLRALDGRGDVEPDLSLREAQVGDRYLLCSDGLSTVVSAETIHRTMTRVTDPEQVVRQLIDLANRGGGPDNITCVVADVVDLTAPPMPPGAKPVLAGAAASASVPPGTQATQTLPGPVAADTPAQRAATLRDTMPQPAVVVDDLPPEPLEQPAPVSRRRAKPQRRWTWLFVAVAVFVLLLGAGGFAGWRWSQGQYYIGQDKGEVVIFQGFSQAIGGLDTSKVRERPAQPLRLVDLPRAQQETVKNTIDAKDLKDAQGILATLRNGSCKFSVGEDKGEVVIKQGVGQTDCEVKVSQIDPPIKVGDLQKARLQQVKKGIAGASPAELQKTVDELRDNATFCSQQPEVADCPKKRP